MRTATVVQQLCKSCSTCFKFHCMFYFTCDRSLIHSYRDDGSLEPLRCGGAGGGFAAEGYDRHHDTAGGDGLRVCIQRFSRSIARYKSLASINRRRAIAVQLLIRWKIRVNALNGLYRRLGALSCTEPDNIQCESKKSPLGTCGNFSKTGGNFLTKFYVPTYARLRRFIQLSATLTKL